MLNQLINQSSLFNPNYLQEPKLNIFVHIVLRSHPKIQAVLRVILNEPKDSENSIFPAEYERENCLKSSITKQPLSSGAITTNANWLPPVLSRMLCIPFIVIPFPCHSEVFNWLSYLSQCDMIYASSIIVTQNITGCSCHTNWNFMERQTGECRGEGMNGNMSVWQLQKSVRLRTVVRKWLCVSQDEDSKNALIGCPICLTGTLNIYISPG